MEEEEGLIGRSQVHIYLEEEEEEGLICQSAPLGPPFTLSMPSQRHTQNPQPDNINLQPYINAFLLLWDNINTQTKKQ